MWGEDEELLRKLVHLTEHNLLVQERILLELKLIRKEVFQPILGFTITQEPPMLTISPGNKPVFTATPVPATSVPSTPPVWTSSDVANAPVIGDPTGLIGTVDIPDTAVVGTKFTLTVSYTNADQTVATGSINLEIVASSDIKSFTIEQTA